MRVHARRLVVGAAVVVAMLGLSSAVRAQSAPAATAWSVVTYYRCAQGDAPRADAIVKEHVVPFLKAEQAAGHIAGYGWNEHVEGGEWRRVLYMTGTNSDALFGARENLSKMITAPEHAKAFEEFGRLCGSHDDYIWRLKSGSQSGADAGRVRSAFSMSTYYACGPDETEADAILGSVLAPVLDARVKDGSIDSWNWLEHMFGGQYRRLLLVDAKSERALLTNWAKLQDDAQKAAPDLARRLSQICHDHTDYIWQKGLN